MRLELQAGKLTHKSERAERKMKRIVKAALHRMAGIALRTAKDKAVKPKVAKAASAIDAVVEDIMDALLEELQQLAKDVRDPMMDAASQGVLQYKPQIKDADMITDANAAARDWADDRAAELVGMKWVDGELIENPNPQWAISDTIRDRINRIVSNAFADTNNFDAVIESIADIAEFSDYRAEMVARTEIARAQIQGNLSLWDEIGMVKTYDWLLSEDEDVCEECEAIADGGPYKLGIGPIPIDDSHPNCRCIIVSNEFEMPEEAEEPKAASLVSDLTKSTTTEATMPDTKKDKTKQEGQHFFLALPITKFDEEQRIVEGIATAEMLDKQGDIVDFASACKAFDNWEGNIREQHDPKKPVGTAISYTPMEDQKAMHLSARISKGAQDTWEKVKDGTLKYFSIGCPFGSYERTPEVIKVDGKDQQANRLFLHSLSEVSLVDSGACPAAKIGLWKSESGLSDQVEESEEAPAAPKVLVVGDAAKPLAKMIDRDTAIALGLEVPEGIEKLAVFGMDAAIEKLTEDAGSYADPGWQSDGKKRYPLDTEEHAKAAASYFGRPKNRKKYTSEQQGKIDAKIKAAKKKFKIGEFAEKSDGMMDLCKCDCGTFSPLSWVPLNDYNPQAQSGAPVSYYVPRTFGDVWEDTEDADMFPMMGAMFGKTIANILCSQLDGKTQKELIQRSVDELMEELNEEFMEADEIAAEFAEDAQKAIKADLTKAGKRNSAADQDSIQAVHDHACKLGAECMSAKDDDEKKMANIVAHLADIEKALVPLIAVGSMKPVFLSAEAVEKLAGAGITVEKLAEIRTELEASMATKDDIAKMNEITSNHAGEIEKAATAMEDVTKRLEVVEKQPALSSLPATRQALGMSVTDPNSAAAEPTEKIAEIALLTKMENETDNPLTKEAIGKEIFLKKYKLGIK